MNTFQVSLFISLSFWTAVGIYVYLDAIERGWKKKYAVLIGIASFLQLGVLIYAVMKDYFAKRRVLVAVMKVISKRPLNSKESIEIDLSLISEETGIKNQALVWKVLKNLIKNGQIPSNVEILNEHEYHSRSTQPILERHSSKLSLLFFGLGIICGFSGLWILFSKDILSGRDVDKIVGGDAYNYIIYATRYTGVYVRGTGLICLGIIFSIIGHAFVNIALKKELSQPVPPKSYT